MDILRILRKPLFHAFFDCQGFDGFCSGDTFVEIACNSGIYFPDLTVYPNQLFLKNGKQDHQKGQNGENHGSKFCI